MDANGECVGSSAWNVPDLSPDSDPLPISVNACRLVSLVRPHRNVGSLGWR